MRLDFGCEIMNEVVIGLDDAIQPLATNVQINMGTKQTSFNLHMGTTHNYYNDWLSYLGLFDGNFTHPIPSDVEIVVPQMLNIGLETRQIGNDSNFRLQAKDCWATPT